MGFTSTERFYELAEKNQTLDPAVEEGLEAVAGREIMVVMVTTIDNITGASRTNKRPWLPPLLEKVMKRP